MVDEQPVVGDADREAAGRRGGGRRGGRGEQPHDQGKGEGPHRRILSRRGDARSAGRPVGRPAVRDIRTYGTSYSSEVKLKGAWGPSHRARTLPGPGVWIAGT